MIEIVMYVVLGFLLANLVALLLAPPLWHRAVKLTTRRLEATMPMSASEIQAEKDQQRADFAVQIRRVEIALAKAKDNAARNLVERSKGQARISEMTAEMAALQSRLDEQSAELRVLEQTVQRRFPELEGELEEARRVIALREGELFRLSNAFTNQSDALAATKDMARARHEEIEQLRLALEGDRSALTTLKLRKIQSPTQENQKLIAENHRLTAELSRLHEELTTLKTIFGRENDLLKLEMRRLADQILRAGMERKAAQAKLSSRGIAIDAEVQDAEEEPVPETSTAVAEEPRAIKVQAEPEPEEEPTQKKRVRRTSRRKTTAKTTRASKAKGSLTERLANLANTDS